MRVVSVFNKIVERYSLQSVIDQATGKRRGVFQQEQYIENSSLRCRNATNIRSTVHTTREKSMAVFMLKTVNIMRLKTDDLRRISLVRGLNLSEG